MILKDVFGKALLDYNENHFNKSDLIRKPKCILTWTNISDKDELPLSYLFRSYNNMPEVEKIALNQCRGSVLDVGCGAGNHLLHLQKKGLHVKGIDISKGAVEVCKKRGVKHVEETDILKVKDTFDTILLLMNGTGIFQTVENTYIYLNHLKSILNEHGQILIDSTDILYMYQDENGQLEEELPETYYGELDYFYSYDGEEEYGMKWLYLDFELLHRISGDVGLNCEKIYSGKQHNYLARLSLKN